MSEGKNTQAAIQAVSLLWKLGSAYAEARAIAAQAGVTPADLDAADARFAKVYADPLARPEAWKGPGLHPPMAPPAQPARPFAVGQLLDEQPELTDLELDEELWQRNADGKFIVVQQGVGVPGGPSSPGWNLIHAAYST